MKEKTMLNKKSIGAALVCALALGASGAAFATPVDVNGVHWDTDDSLYLTIDSLNLRETQVQNPGDMLTGYGQIGGIDGDLGFCTGCELTFTFSYVVQSVNGNQVVFNSGSFQFYTQAPNTYDVTDPTSVGGTPWVTLTGHDQNNATFTDNIGQLFATVTGPITNPQLGSSGTGLVDATGGPAMSFLQFNNIADGLGGFADLNLSSSFNFKLPNGCSSISSDPDDQCHYPIGGTGQLVGNTMIPVSVPEPAELGLLGLGLGALGFFIRRRRKELKE